MATESTFFWYDLETFGADSRADRIAQFAGIRTDLEFQPVDEPIIQYCQPDPDYLPDPEAINVTGITPQQARMRGCTEPEFAAVVYEQFSTPNTCGAGFNSVRFDDEFVRNLFYRNFFPIFDREWQNGNSRWDLIDVARMTYALRPKGVEWPEHEPGKPSFRLEDLARENAVKHSHAHDALSDVEATIGLARVLKGAQPRLFDYALKLRDKRFAATALNLVKRQPVVHISSKFPAERGCLAVVLPLCAHPTNPNAAIVVDLATDPRPLIDLDADSIAERVFTASADLAEERIPLKTVSFNKCPMIAPLAVLRDVDHERIQLNLERNLDHARALADHDLGAKLRLVFGPPTTTNKVDVEQAIYHGFFSRADSDRLNGIRALVAKDLVPALESFQDWRLNDLLFRRVARFWPDALTKAQRDSWRTDVLERIGSTDQPDSLISRRRASLASIEQPDIRAEVEAYFDEVIGRYSR